MSGNAPIKLNPPASRMLKTLTAQNKAKNEQAAQAQAQMDAALEVSRNWRPPTSRATQSLASSSAAGTSVARKALLGG